MIDMITVLISGLLLGLGMGASCTTFCASVLVPHIMAEHRGVRRGMFTSLLFSLGRLAAYLVLAAVLGTIGRSLLDLIKFWQPPMLMGIGVLLLTYGFSMSYGHVLKLNVMSGVCSFYSSHKSTFTLGVLMGLTPCIPLSTAMAYSITLQNVFLSSLFFIFFWLGSSVYMIGLGSLAGVIGDFAVAQARVSRLRRISGIALASVGLIFLLEGFNP